jgi:hypothetical protein
MFTSEPSYFNFLMKRGCVHRSRVPFAQAVGVMPEHTQHARHACRPERIQPPLPNGGRPGLRRKRQAKPLTMATNHVSRHRL